MMTYRKTWFSWVLWFLYAVLCILLIGAGTYALIQYTAGYSLYPPLLGVLAVIPAAALYWCIRVVAVYARKKWTWKAHTAGVVTGVAFALALAMGILLRIMCLNGYVSGGALPYGINPDSILTRANGASCYEAASSLLSQMRQGGVWQGGAGAAGCNIEAFYVRLLAVVLSFLGDKPDAAVFLQIVLQTVAIVLAYLAARILAGRLPAFFAASYLACSFGCLIMLFQFTPDWLFFDMYMIGMLFLAWFVSAYCKNRLPKAVTVLSAAVSGAVMGFLAYLDLSAYSLVIVILLAVFGTKERQEDRAVRNGTDMTVVIVGTAAFMCIAMRRICMNLDVYLGAVDIADIFDRVRQCFLRFSDDNLMCLPDYSGSNGGFAGIFDLSGHPDVCLIFAAAVFASFLLFEYFRSGKVQNYTPWIWMCLTVAVTPAALCGEHGYSILPMYIWAVLGGLGLQNCLFGDRAKVMQAVIEEINASVETKTNYIENPLPLPKKHVKKDMDYQYDVEEKDMKYDLEVPDDDDYDLK